MTAETTLRHDSLRIKGSYECWIEGLIPFFSDRVPFSYSTGLVLAEYVADLTYAYAQHTKGPIKFLEYGGGLGIFARHYLDILKQKYPDTYPRLSFILTDLSDTAFESIRTHHLFDPHPQKVSLQIVDLLKNAPRIKSNIVFLSYVLDSMPTEHVQVIDGIPHILRIKTEITADDAFINAQQNFPTFLSQDKIQALTQRGASSKAKAFRRLLPYIKETFIPTPLKKSGLTPEDISSITTYVKASGITTGLFNIPLRLPHILKHLFDSTNDDGLVFINDFGWNKADHYSDPKKLTTHYHAISCHALFFPYILHVATAMGWRETWLSGSQEFGDSQFCILSKKPVSEALHTEMKKKGETPAISDLDRAIKEVIALDSPTKDAFCEKIQSLHDHLKPAEQKDYTWLTTCATAFMEKGYFQDAIQTAQKVLPTYSSVGLSNYLLMGRCYMELGDFERSELYLLESLKISPLYSPIYFDLGFLYIRLHRMEDALDALNHFTYLTPDLIWKIHLTISLLLTTIGRLDQAHVLLERIIQIGEQFPTLIDHNIVEQSRIALAQCRAMISKKPE